MRTCEIDSDQLAILARVSSFLRLTYRGDDGVAVGVLDKVLDSAGRSTLESVAAHKVRSIVGEVIAGLPLRLCSIDSFGAVDTVNGGCGHVCGMFQELFSIHKLGCCSQVDGMS